MATRAHDSSTDFMPSNRRLRLAVAASLAAGIGFPACDGNGQATQVVMIDRASAKPAADALALVVGVDKSGKLTLNQIEIGTIADPTILSEKLKAIFEDRRRSSIEETEIVIELTGNVAFDDVGRLIASIRPLRPSRISVMTK